MTGSAMEANHFARDYGITHHSAPHQPGPSRLTADQPLRTAISRVWRPNQFGSAVLRATLERQATLRARPGWAAGRVAWVPQTSHWLPGGPVSQHDHAEVLSAVYGVPPPTMGGGGCPTFDISDRRRIPATRDSASAGLRGRPRHPEGFHSIG
ncbi:hypothetical protein [Streptomyces bottropensis]|uniref:hypothetical protein n=1 Tax=Streptomyces bottropensis TaxID=42235 RepID=UPI0036B168D6